MNYRILRDTKKSIVDKESVTYFLYIKCSFQNLLRGDRVLVISNDQEKMKFAKKSQSKQRNSAVNEDDPLEGRIFNEKYKRFAGEIVKLK